MSEVFNHNADSLFEDVICKMKSQGKLDDEAERYIRSIFAEHKKSRGDNFVKQIDRINSRVLSSKLPKVAMLFESVLAILKINGSIDSEKEDRMRSDFYKIEDGKA